MAYSAKLDVVMHKKINPSQRCSDNELLALQKLIGLVLL